LASCRLIIKGEFGVRYAGLIGNPVEHSLSPHMHNAALHALGLDATYELWQTELEDLPEQVARVREPLMLGANVTVPHKQAVMSLVDEVTGTARRIGAVNTLIPTARGLVGDNTDAFGFRRSLEERFGASPVNTAVVLGAGGAARAVVVALQEMGVGSVILTNRTHARAESLADELVASSVPWEDAPDAAFPRADLLVNATSLGWHDELPVDPAALARLPATAIVMDLTYRDTAFLRAADELGHRTLDGLGMLIHQGARALTLWTGQDAPVDVMRDAVLAEQARRA
jgi:shikimate dehydrogenase